MNLSKNVLIDFGQIQSLSKVSLIVVNEKLQIEHVNECAIETLNLKRDISLIGTSIIDLFARLKLPVFFNKEDEYADTEFILINNFFQKWQRIFVQVNNQRWSLLTGNTISLKDDVFHREKINDILNVNKVIENLPELVYWKDKQCTYQGCNKNVAKLLHLPTPTDIVGKNDYDFGWSEERIKGLQDVDHAVLKQGIDSILEDIIVDDGIEKIFLTSKTPLRDNNNNIVGILGISTDITDRKKMEEELKIAKEKAEAANQAKSDFISNMEHDLKTPFAGIGGIASYLHDTETDEEKKELLSLMVTSCNQWEQVHHRIFDALEVENSQELKIETVSISNELSEIKDMMAATLYMKKLAFEIAPITDDLDKIQTDRTKFRLILSSLISNAINFTEQGMIKVITLREGDGYKIQVTDTGIGIPEDKLDYIFERFSKLARSNKYGADFQGLGLGLYVCREYAKLLGATVQAESKLGEGSTFTVQFPG